MCCVRESKAILINTHSTVFRLSCQGKEIKISTGFSHVKFINDLLKSHPGGVVRVEASMLEWAEEKVGDEELEEPL